MWKAWLLTLVFFIIVSPWLFGFGVAVIGGASISLAAYAGLAMMAYSTIVTIPLGILSALAGMLLHDTSYPVTKGALIGFASGIAISLISRNLYDGNEVAWMVSFGVVGSIVGTAEGALWSRFME